ncbi:hypothetical protein HaLaN_08360 [Haematococcus lacustris]|uniref:Uncharacterized protein n=1 Tax=Haematococcus lacustris TaxID=44745 RepID=A0A699YQK8_HAELA|nr:hypothetical protein HaLaN_08360 [Haematococcus lacustris]
MVMAGRGHSSMGGERVSSALMLMRAWHSTWPSGVPVEGWQPAGAAGAGPLPHLHLGSLPGVQPCPSWADCVRWGGVPTYQASDSGQLVGLSQCRQVAVYRVQHRQLTTDDIVKNQYWDDIVLYVVELSCSAAAGQAHKAQRHASSTPAVSCSTRPGGTSACLDHFNSDRHVCATAVACIDQCWKPGRLEAFLCKATSEETSAASGSATVGTARCRNVRCKVVSLTAVTVHQSHETSSFEEVRTGGRAGSSSCGYRPRTGHVAAPMDHCRPEDKASDAAHANMGGATWEVMAAGQPTVGLQSRAVVQARGCRRKVASTWRGESMPAQASADTPQLLTIDCSSGE